MTQEEKSILLKDLCARLPYGVEVYYTETVPISTLKTINSEKGTCIVYDHSQWYRNNKLQIEAIKPYLRPMSSMTEEEKKELKELHFCYADGHIANDEDNNFKPIIVDEVHCSCIIDWLKSHHFDYRGLIEKGLALEAKEWIYNLNK
jgi:hypothetical protein